MSSQWLPPSCPHQENCLTDAHCEYRRKVDIAFAQFNEVLKGKAPSIMSSNSPKITPADVAAQAEKENLTVGVTVPEQNVKAAPSTGEKAKEVVEETTETVKKTLKDRATSLVTTVKNNKKFFAGFAAGVASTFVAAVLMPKTQTEEVEIVVIDDTLNEDESGDSQPDA